MTHDASRNESSSTSRDDELLEEHLDRVAPLPVELPLSDEVYQRSLDLRTQIFRFIVTGVFSAVVDFGLHVIMVVLFGVPVAVSKAISFVAGTSTAYVINRRWTFRAEHSTKRLLAVMALYGVTFVVQVGINQLMYHLLSNFADIYRLFFAFVVAQGTATVINFIVQRAVIFKLDD